MSKTKTSQKTERIQKSSKAPKTPKTTATHWGNVAESYDKHLSNDATYHSEVIWPNLKRLLADVSDKSVLDVACGQGYFSELLSGEGANVTAFDMGADLIAIAKKNAEKNSKNKIHYFVADAQNFSIGDKFDVAICILALQNIENAKGTIESIKKSLKPKGKVILILNHPAFRIPKHSSWQYDQDIQYRRVDTYMSEEKIKLDMTPGKKKQNEKEYTYSFHRPLQYYFKLFANAGFAVTRLEEWVSNRESVGKHAVRENKARHEFPLFMCVELKVLD